MAILLEPSSALLAFTNTTKIQIVPVMNICLALMAAGWLSCLAVHLLGYGGAEIQILALVGSTIFREHIRDTVLLASLFL